MTEIANDLHGSPAAPQQLEGNLPVEPEAAEPNTEGLRAAYEGWLERRGIDPASIPHRTMGPQEFDIFRNAPNSYLPYVWKTYKIPKGDQYTCQYAFINVTSGDTGLPPSLELIDVSEADYGTAVDSRIIAKDFQDPDSDPDDPMPESGSAYVTADISETLTDSYGDLEKFAAALMQEETEDPFRSTYADVAVRASGLAPGQKDAYVWKTEPITRAVELTLLSPSTYDSVCVVRGHMRAAGNGKPGMAQVENPAIVLQIKGEDLEELQRIYRALYRQPGFALTKIQRESRSRLFNDHVIHLISQQARMNSDRRDDETRRQQPLLRYRERPS